MSRQASISFTGFAPPKAGVAVVLVPKGGGIAPEATAVADRQTIDRAISAAAFKGAANAAVEILAPQGSPLDRLVLVGAGDAPQLKSEDWMKLGGAAFARIARADEATVMLALAGTSVSAQNAADFALGALLRAYSFDKYKTRKRDDDEGAPENGTVRIAIQIADPAAAQRAFEPLQAVGQGVHLARDLVNEPANVLGPVEFARRAEELSALGVSVEPLDEEAMRKLGMGALLGVAQGSVRPPRLVVMQWNGAKAQDRPVAFVGKGVVFDSGGISIKPASGMEDMKGDMGGAAAVTGLMHALARRKAKVNAVGIIGLVENMPDGNAQRPGDIVTSMSGQTIEVINTDAEGRLVLADALWYCSERFKPRFMIDLATLTGAVIVALGHHHAGLFCNDDALSEQLLAAGTATGEKLWRLPLGPEYDKMIDSKFADVKNSGGRHAGSITAAQFLKRFVKDTPWAHLDIAGTAMGAASGEYNQSWGSGFGVRLLDRLLQDNHEE